jgi:1,2-dihydroxy-3-keto-5-methylthiopentene dioxygenase
MSELCFPDQNFKTTDFEEMVWQLAKRGIEFTRWTANQKLSDDATQEEILAAYDHEITPYMQRKGFLSADVINVHPGLDNLPALREKFLSEHIHTEDEVRFFVDGSGTFWFHFDNGDVASIVCTQGDFLSVPAGIKHWFDLAPNYHVKAIRIFTSKEGWVANYTGSGVDKKYNV